MPPLLVLQPLLQLLPMLAQPADNPRQANRARVANRSRFTESATGTFTLVLDRVLAGVDPADRRAAWSDATDAVLSHLSGLDALAIEEIAVTPTVPGPARCRPAAGVMRRPSYRAKNAA